MRMGIKLSSQHGGLLTALEDHFKMEPISEGLTQEDLEQLWLQFPCYSAEVRLSPTCRTALWFPCEFEDEPPFSHAHSGNGMFWR